MKGLSACNVRREIFEKNRVETTHSRNAFCRLWAGFLCRGECELGREGYRGGQAGQRKADKSIEDTSLQANAMSVRQIQLGSRGDFEFRG